MARGSWIMPEVGVGPLGGCIRSEEGRESRRNTNMAGDRRAIA